MIYVRDSARMKQEQALAAKRRAEVLTKAERDAMRADAARVGGAWTPTERKLADHVLRLLDHIERPIAGVTAGDRDAVRTEGERLVDMYDPSTGTHRLGVSIIRVVSALEAVLEAPPASEGPALAALRRLVAALEAYDGGNGPGAHYSQLAYDADVREARALLKRGAERHAGPWALRCADDSQFWWKADAKDFGGNGRFGHWDPRKHERVTFPILGPRTVEGSARWVQACVGGVIVKVRSKT